MNSIEKYTTNSTLQTTSTQNKNLSSTNSASFEKALNRFYEIHQRSQITGVSTFEYNKALNDLGLKKGDNFKAIHLLQNNGYNTNAPSIESIVKYGNTSQKIGNHSYMKEETKVDVPNKLATSEQVVTSEKPTMTKEVSTTPKPYNYFDAAKKISAIIPQEKTKLTLSNLLQSEIPKSNEQQTSTFDLLELTQKFLSMQKNTNNKDILITLLNLK